MAQNLPFLREGRGGLDNIPHQNEWADEKTLGKDAITAITVPDRYCGEQDVEGHGMGHEGSKCSGIRIPASRNFFGEARHGGGTNVTRVRGETSNT